MTQFVLIDLGDYCGKTRFFIRNNQEEMDRVIIKEGESESHKYDQYILLEIDIQKGKIRTVEKKGLIGVLDFRREEKEKK